MPPPSAGPAPVSFSPADEYNRLAMQQTLASIPVALANMQRLLEHARTLLPGYQTFHERQVLERRAAPNVSVPPASASGPTNDTPAEVKRIAAVGGVKQKSQLLQKTSEPHRNLQKPLGRQPSSLPARTAAAPHAAAGAPRRIGVVAPPADAAASTAKHSNAAPQFVLRLKPPSSTAIGRVSSFNSDSSNVGSIAIAAPVRSQPPDAVDASVSVRLRGAGGDNTKGPHLDVFSAKVSPVSPYFISSFPGSSLNSEGGLAMSLERSMAPTTNRSGGPWLKHDQAASPGPNDESCIQAPYSLDVIQRQLLSLSESLAGTSSHDAGSHHCTPPVALRRGSAAVPLGCGALTKHSSYFSVVSTRSGAGPKYLVSATQSWRSKTHAKGLLSAIVGIPPINAADPHGNPLQRTLSSLPSNNDAPSSENKSQENTATLASSTESQMYVNPASTVTTAGSGSATSSSSCAALLKRIQEELLRGPAFSSTGQNDLSFVRSLSAMGHMVTSETAESHQAQRSASAAADTSGPSAARVPRRHYAQENIFERLASVGTEAHPMPPATELLAGQRFGAPPANSRRASIAVPGVVNRMPPLSSVAAPAIAEMSQAVWVGNLRYSESKAGLAPRQQHHHATTAAATQASRTMEVAAAQAPLKSAGINVKSNAVNPKVLQRATVTVPSTRGIWCRLYDEADKKKKALEGQKSLTAPATRSPQDAALAAPSSHHHAMHKALHTSSGAAQSNAKATTGAHKQHTVCQGMPSFVQRLYHKDAKSKEELRLKKEQQEQHEQQRLQRERNEIFDKVARFREQQQFRGAHPTGGAGPPPVGSLQPKDLAAASGSKGGLALPLALQQWQAEVPPDDQRTNTSGEENQSFVLTPYGTWQRTSNNTIAAGHQRGAANPPGSAPQHDASVTGPAFQDPAAAHTGMGSSQTKLRSLSPTAPLSGTQRFAAVSPVDFAAAAGAASKKSNRMNHVPHSRTSSYVSASGSPQGLQYSNHSTQGEGSATLQAAHSFLYAAARSRDDETTASRTESTPPPPPAFFSAHDNDEELREEILDVRVAGAEQPGLESTATSRAPSDDEDDEGAAGAANTGDAVNEGRDESTAHIQLDTSVSKAAEGPITSNAIIEIAQPVEYQQPRVARLDFSKLRRPPPPKHR